MDIQSILNVPVSVLFRCNSKELKRVTLLKFLTTVKFKEAVLAIRAEPDEVRQTEMKETLLLAAMCCGVFDFRRKEGIKQFSGFASIDIDEKDNLHIENYADLKTEIAKIPCVAYCGLSVRGKGYFVLIHLAYPDKYEQHFQALNEDFAAMGVNIDSSCGNITRLRFVSYDIAPYFNHTALKYSRLYEAPEPTRRAFTVSSSVTQTRVEKLIAEIGSREIDITAGLRNWVKLCYALVNEFGENGRQYFHDISTFNHNYDYNETDKQYSYCLSRKNTSTEKSAKIGSLFDRCKEFGILANRPFQSFPDLDDNGKEIPTL